MNNRFLFGKKYLFSLVVLGYCLFSFGCGKKVNYIPDEIPVITDFPVKLEDFAVPAEYRGTFVLDGWSVSRKRTPVWSVDQVGEYWVDPVDIGLEYLEALNDREIENLFKGID